MHAVMGWARAGALPSLCLLVVACVDGESAAIGELDEARAATASGHPGIPSHFSFTLESGATVEAELVRAWPTADDERLLFRSGGREVEVRTFHGKAGDIVMKGQKILQNAHVLAEATFHFSGEVVARNARGDAFRGRGSLEIDRAGTSTFDPLAISLLDERTRAGLYQLGLTPEVEPEECDVCLRVALESLTIDLDRAPPTKERR